MLLSYLGFSRKIMIVLGINKKKNFLVFFFIFFVVGGPFATNYLFTGGINTALAQETWEPDDTSAVIRLLRLRGAGGPGTHLRHFSTEFLFFSVG
jgi:hypothetical protein